MRANVKPTVTIQLKKPDDSRIYYFHRLVIRKPSNLTPEFIDLFERAMPLDEDIAREWIDHWYETFPTSYPNKNELSIVPAPELKRYLIEEDDAGQERLVETDELDPVYMVGVDSPYLGKTLEQLEGVWLADQDDGEGDEVRRARVLKMIREKMNEPA